MYRIFFLSTILCFAATVQAATYSVANSGRDSNPGTDASPFLTISRAVAAAGAGDTVVVRAGTYRERVLVWQKRGRENAPIRIVAARGARPVIDGRGMKAENALVVIGRSDWIHFEGFEIRGSTSAGLIVYEADHVRVRWNVVHDCTGAGIHASGAGLLIEGNSVTNTVLQNRSGKASQWAQALACEDSRGVSIIRNYVFRNYGEGIDVIRSSRVTVARNDVADNFSANIYLDNAQFATVDANFVHDSGGTRFRRDGEPPFGIAMANERYSRQTPLTHLTITNNVVLRTRAGIYYYDGEYGGGLHHVVISHNTLYAFPWAALVLGRSSRATGHDTTFVTNNVIVQRPSGAFVSGQTRGVVFRSNAWWGGRSETGVKGSGDVRADPRFVRTGGSRALDFALQSGSPCRDAARSGPRVATDYSACTRPRGAAADLGAFEICSR